MVDFEDIPEVFKDYIAARASRIASNRMVNNPQSAELMAQDDGLMRALAIEYDTKQAEHNIFNDQEYRTNQGNVYRPYKVLQRR